MGPGINDRTFLVRQNDGFGDPHNIQHTDEIHISKVIDDSLH